MGTDALTVRDDTPLLADDFAEAAWTGAKPQRSEQLDLALHSSAPQPVAPPPLANRDFFVGKSLTELAREAGAKPIRNISVFAGGFPEDEDLDELLAALERIRDS